MTAANDPEYTPSRRQKHQLTKKPDKVLIELPMHSLAEASANLAVRCHQSTSYALTLFARVIKKGRSDIHDFVLSCRSVWRPRIIRDKKGADSLQKWKRILDDPTVSFYVGWDGKKVKYSDG